MVKPRFLLDEHVSWKLAMALVRKEPAIDIVCVGGPGAPPLRTPDPDLLLAAEASGRVLVTKDRKTMVKHLADHFTAGYHTWGVILMRIGFLFVRHIDTLLLVWNATSADEWLDRTDYIPY